MAPPTASPSMTKRKIVLVPFPFDDLSGDKVRPALYLTDNLGCVRIATSSPQINSNPNPEHLFQFEFAPVENIKPWGDNDGGRLSLSLYALTDGHFRISVGSEALLRYTPEIISHWGLHNEDAEYQVACFARDVLASVPAVISPIPTFFESIVRNETLFRQLRAVKTSDDCKEVHYNAFRWLGERSLWLNYLTGCPDIWFVRVGNEVWIQWDNIDRKLESIDVWTARCGTYRISAQAFLAECQSFSERVLAGMESRIVSVEQGFVRAQIPLDTVALRNQLSEFKNEFEKYLTAEYQPDVDWQKSEKALENIAIESRIALPSV